MQPYRRPSVAAMFVVLIVFLAINVVALVWLLSAHVVRAAVAFAVAIGLQGAWVWWRRKVRR